MNTSSNYIDHLVALTKGTVGLTPFIGGFLAEFIGVIVPNQRQDRIAKYVEILGKILASTEEAQFKARSKDEGFLDLFEDGLLHAVRAQTDERMLYIASVIKNSIEDEDVEYARYKHILGLLSELNDVQIILLKYRAIRHTELSREYYDAHKGILQAPAVHMGSPQTEIDDKTIIESYRDHLVRLGLLEQEFTKPKRGEAPEYDLKTGMIKAKGYKATRLGHLLLRMIDQASE